MAIQRRADPRGRRNIGKHDLLKQWVNTEVSRQTNANPIMQRRAKESRNQWQSTTAEDPTVLKRRQGSVPLDLRPSEKDWQAINLVTTVIPLPLFVGLRVASLAYKAAKNLPKVRKVIDYTGRFITSTRAGNLNIPRAISSNRTEYVSSIIDQTSRSALTFLEKNLNKLSGKLWTIENKANLIPLSRTEKIVHKIGDKMYNVLEPVERKLRTRIAELNIGARSPSPIIKQADKLYKWASRPRRLGNLGTGGPYMIERAHNLNKYLDSINGSKNK